MDIATTSATQLHYPANWPLIGVQIHSFLLYRDSREYLIEGNTFEMFIEQLTGCEGSTAMDVEPQVYDSLFMMLLSTVKKWSSYSYHFASF